MPICMQANFGWEGKTVCHSRQGQSEY